jgi:hypothetical protein
MRKFTGILILLVTVGTLLTNCDEENNSSRDYLKIGDTEYAVSYGILENWGSMSDGVAGEDWSFDGYNIDFTLCSEGVGLIEGDKAIEHSGDGQMIYFELLSSSNTSLASGVYNFDDKSVPCPVMTFDYASYSTDWNESNLKNNWVWITSGSITVSRNGSQYDISINCKDENDLPVIGHFKGTLSYYNHVPGLKSATLVQKIRINK